ncbi:MAG: haloacid dehalogenase type II [bacterium]
MLNFSQFEVLTFDCYGTLIDWEQGIINSLKPVFQKHSIDLPDNEILEYFAVFESEVESGEFLAYRDILQTVLECFGDVLNFVPTDRELQDFPNSIQNWPPFPDTVAALQNLAQKYKFAIISNVDDNLFAHSAKHLQVKFDWVITAQQVGAYKPSLENFRFAFRKIGVEPAKILHVAQSLYHDHAPAQKLGMTTVWVNRRKGLPGKGATPPADAKPDLEVADLKSLVDLMIK